MGNNETKLTSYEESSGKKLKSSKTYNKSGRQHIVTPNNESARDHSDRLPEIDSPENSGNQMTFL